MRSCHASLITHETYTGALEETTLASIHKKGAPKVALTVVAQDVPAKKKCFSKDRFTGEDIRFAAKPASVRLRCVC